jgi:phosphoglucomutase
MQKKGFGYSDALKLIFEDGSWVAVRPSGTEPKCKFYYCVVAEYRSKASEKLEAIKSVFERF